MKPPIPITSQAFKWISPDKDSPGAFLKRQLERIEQAKVQEARAKAGIVIITRRKA